MTSYSSSSSSLLLTCTQSQPPSLRNRICRIRRRWCGERRTTNRWWNDCNGWLFLAVTITIFRTTIAMPHLLRTKTTTITNTRMCAFPSSTSNRIAWIPSSPSLSSLFSSQPRGSLSLWPSRVQSSSSSSSSVWGSKNNVCKKFEIYGVTSWRHHGGRKYDRTYCIPIDR
jgi:hypothetical protein